MEIKDVLIPAEQLTKLQRFYHQAAADKKARVVLKKL